MYIASVWHVVVYHTFFSLYLFSFYDELPKDKNIICLFTLILKFFLVHLVLVPKNTNDNE